MQCSYCKEPNAKHCLLLENLRDWESGFQCICFGCWQKREKNDNEQEFKKMANHQWNLRRRMAQKDEVKSRGIAWRQALSDIGQRHPGQSKAEWRETVKKLCREVVVAFEVAFKKMEQEEKNKYLIAFEEHTSLRQAIASDPTFVPEDTKEVFVGPDGPSKLLEESPCPYFLTSFETSFASEIIPGIDNFFICRQRSCRFIGPNTCWVTEEGHGHFKCPRCCTLFRPWKTTSACIKPNKIMIVSPNGDEMLAQALGMDAKGYSMYYIEWADTPLERLQSRMKEITLGLKDLKDEEEILQQVIKVVNAKAQRVYWRQESLEPWVMQHFDDINKACKKPWSYAHLVHGFWATTGPEYNDDVTPILNTEDMLTLYAHVRFALEAVSSKRKK
jgi:hypothetical protein